MEASSLANGSAGAEFPVFSTCANHTKMANLVNKNNTNQLTSLFSFVSDRFYHLKAHNKFIINLVKKYSSAPRDTLSRLSQHKFVHPPLPYKSEARRTQIAQ